MGNGSRGSFITNPAESIITSSSENENGELVTRKELRYNVPELPQFLGYLGGSLPPPNAELGGGVGAGAGLWGANVEITKNPSTGFLTVNFEGTYWGIGVGATIVQDKNGNIIHSEGFGGGQLIVGGEGDVLGIGIGLEGVGQLGVFIDTAGIHIGTDFDVTLGVGFGSYTFEEEFKWRVYDFDHCFGAEVPIDMWPLDPSLKPDRDDIYDQD